MGLMIIPFTLQLAFGWTNLGLYLNIIAVSTLIPCMVWLVSIYGSIGACFVWVALYFGQIVVMIHLMHTRILKSEKRKWYIDDVIKPLWAPLIIIIVSRSLMDEIISISISIMLASMLSVFFLAICASALSAPMVRDNIFTKILNVKRKN